MPSVELNFSLAFFPQVVALFKITFMPEAEGLRWLGLQDTFIPEALVF